MIRKDIVTRILREKGIKQAAFAAQIGFSAKHFSEIINGKSGQTLKNFEKIAQGLGISITELIAEFIPETTEDRAARKPPKPAEETNDEVAQTVVLLRGLLKNPDKLPESDKDILRSIMKHGLKALDDDPDIERIASEIR